MAEGDSLRRLKKLFLAVFVVAMFGQLIPDVVLAQTPTRPPAFGDPGTRPYDFTEGYYYNYYPDPAANLNREVFFRTNSNEEKKFLQENPTLRTTGGGIWRYNDPARQLAYELEKDPVQYADYTVLMPDGTTRTLDNFNDIDAFLRRYPGAKVTSRTDAVTLRFNNANINRNIPFKLNPLPGIGQEALTLLLTAISLIVGLLLWLGSVIVDAVFVFIVSILLEILKFNHFTDVAQLVEVWKIMRDLSNMFFIVIVIFIAFGTMLRLEQYEWKHLLPKVVLAALAINFSRTITGLLIDVGQVVMLTFVKAMEGAGVGNFQHMFSVTKNLFFLATGGNALAGIQGVLTADATGSLFIVLSILLSFGYLVIATTTMATFLGMLVFRIIALWMLVIFSPLAFVMSAFPQGEDYAQKWWQQLTANIIVGPVLAFFLWVALLFNTESVQNAGGAGVAGAAGGSTATGLASLVEIVSGAKKWQELVSVPLLQVGGASDFMGKALDPANFITMLMSVTILSIGMAAAQELGSAGAEMVKEGAEHIKGAGKWMVGGAFGAYDRTMAGLGKTVTKEDSGFKQVMGWIATANSLRSVKEGYTNFRHQQEHETYTGSTGKVQDMLHAKFNMTGWAGGGLRTVADKLDEGVDAKVREIERQLADPTVIQDENEKKKLNDQKVELLASKQNWAWMRYEGISGRTGGVYQKMEEEKGISEQSGAYTATNFTAEQLSKIFRENVGSGNVHVLQGLIRSIITGNNQDDLSRVQWLNENKSFLGDDEVGMRLKSEMQNAVVNIQSQNALRDKQRSAGKGDPRDFNYKRWEADTVTEENRINASDLTPEKKVEEINKMKVERADDAKSIFNNDADHTVKPEAAWMFEALKSTTTFKEYNEKDHAWKDVTKEKVASIASQGGVLAQMEQRGDALSKAFLRGFKMTKAEIDELVPPMGTSSKTKKSLQTHLSLDEQLSKGQHQTPIKVMLDAMPQETVQFQGSIVTVNQISNGSYKTLDEEEYAELRRLLLNKYVTGQHGRPSKGDNYGQQPGTPEGEGGEGAEH